MKKFMISKVISVGFIILLFILLIFKIFSVRNQVLEAEIYSRQHINTLDQINSIRSSLAHLSMWQLSFTTEENEVNQNLARRNISKLSDQISIVTDSICSKKYIDSTYLNRLSISVNQLLLVSKQVMDTENVFNDDIIIDSLNVDYRSIYDILTFHLNTVQELTIIKMNKRSKEQYADLLSQIIVEIVIITIIALIIIIIVMGRRKAERLLSETESYFDDVVNSSPSALIGVRHDGTIFQMNKAAQELSKLENWHDNSVEICFKKFSCMNELTKALKNDDSFYHKELIEDYNGINVFTITTFPFSSSNRQGAVLRIEEITTQDKMEEELRQTQKMNAIGQLAGGIAHDFNNTLGAIMGATDLLQFNCENADDLEYLQMISDATSRAADLTTNLLTFARKNHREKGALNLHEIISSTENLIQHSINKNITIDLDLQAETDSIIGDFSELQNLLLNLAINANHAMPDGGSIVINTQNVKLSSEDCANLSFNPLEGEYVKVNVSDTGSGISQANLKRIFEPFFTTKENGTGIGLASVYGTIQQHKGSINVKSTVGEGTVFEIYFPLIKSKIESPKTTKTHITSGVGTILVADDEEIIRRTLQLMLKRMGYTVILASNGVEAVEIFKKEQDSIDLIMLDMIMPVMTGLEALNKIREENATIPVIIASGYAHSEDMEKAKQLNVSDTLSKPYSAKQLSDSVSSILKPN